MNEFWTVLGAVAAVLVLVGPAYSCGVKVGSTRTLKALNNERERSRFVKVYAPLFGLFTTCHITISTGRAAPYLRHRLRNAREVLFEERKPLKAFAALFDKQDLGKDAEVEYGDRFPLVAITKHLRGLEGAADRELIVLVARANRAQYEDNAGAGLLTQEELQLYEHISAQHEYLSRKFGRT